MEEQKYSGVIVPLITPFMENGKIDETSLRKLVQYIIENNCYPFILGTTGESASVSINDYPIAAKAMVEATEGLCRTYASISSNNFETSVWLAQQMLEIGVDTAVAHPPNYYPISEEHILSYFEKLADTIRMPLIIYNIPVTTHHSIPLDVVEKLSYHPNIVGIKDSERDEERLKHSLQRWSSRTDFAHLSGWGAQFTNALMQGSDGIVPSTANITPYLYHKLVQQAKSGNSTNARHLQGLTDQFSEIYQKGRLLSDSLAGLKVILSEIGLCGTTVLPPLRELNMKDKEIIIQKTRGLIEQMTDDPFGVQITWP